ncbi:aminopeptidase P family protein [Amnibacterium sp. CER49]|uniref:aminopeptidase P family protein n=1 Tax=Amnibacterium sp. CER49 TaxID=3039161 RepID=UPI00244CA61B|nr:aminopeptidase P family protein [Amnibacterium sp. CER49]MDH2445323.1 aminopeptidase P family protein [Amnibacterium sp. CER49]
MTDEQTADTIPAEGRDVEAPSRTSIPKTEAFARYIASGWADRPRPLPPLTPLAARAAGRRDALSSRHQGERLVIAAGDAKVRSNDTDYPYRAHSAFSWLTAWGADTVPGSLLVLEPQGDGHEATLYFQPAAGRDTDEFYANAAIGEFWVGRRPSLEEVGAELGIATKPLADFAAGDADVTIDDEGLDRDLSEARLVKDDDEIAELRAAVAATKQGFDDVLAALPRATEHERGERVIEGVFFTRARSEGNELGYDTIAAAGPHACILHWTRNDGPVVPGDLVLLDAGVEMPSLYTADITRTIPVSGRFSPVQREIYEAVREAADAAFAIVKPGIRFRDVHLAAMDVIARRVQEWGLPELEQEALDGLEGQAHRRYMVHGTSHHLGLDVHDCAAARRELYMDGIIEPGMVFTIEPGLYFQPDDLTVPEDFRGIGVRIEDDVLVTADGVENLSAGIPRTADDVEAWIAERQGR